MAGQFYLTEDDVRYQREVNARVMQELAHTDKPGALSGNGVPGGTLWIPTVIKNGRYGGVRYPWIIYFSSPLVLFRGAMAYEVYPLLLPASVMRLDKFYVYLTDSSDEMPNPRWSASKITPQAPDPIRYLCTLTPDPENDTIIPSDLPAGVVTMPGGPADVIRQAIERTAYTADVLANVTPWIRYTGSFTSFDLRDPRIITDDSISSIELSEFSELPAPFLVIANGSLHAMEELPDAVGNLDPVRVVAKLGQSTTLGFRSIELQDPAYAATLGSRQISSGGDYVDLTQDYIKPDGSTARATHRFGLTSAVYADLYVDYTPATNGLYFDAAVLCASDDPPEDPPAGYTRFIFRVGKIIPREFGGALVEMYYPLIAPEYGVPRANWVYTQIHELLYNTQTGVFARLNSLESRVTALEQRN